MDNEIPGLAPVSDEQIASEDPLRRQKEANDTGFFSAVGTAFRSGDNAAYQIYKRVDREASYPEPVQGYNPEADLEQNKKHIPAQYWKELTNARSPQEFNTNRLELQSQIKDEETLAMRGGFSTFVARGLAGMVDIDTPLVFITGGVAATGKAARWARLGRSALAGGASAMAVEAASASADPTGDWAAIPMAGLVGMGFGVVGGAFSKGASADPGHIANEAIQRARQEFSDTLDEGTPLANRDIRNDTHAAPDDAYSSVRTEQAELEAAELAKAEPSPEGAKPQTFDLEDVDQIPDSVGDASLSGQGASVGASQLNPTGSIANIVDQRSLDMVQDSQTWARQTGVVTDYFDGYSKLTARNPAVANAVRRFHDTVTATPIGTDFDRMMKSGSVVGQRLGYDLFENASGIVRNNRSAAMLKDTYDKRMLGTFMPDYEDGLNKWAKDTDASWLSKVTDPEVRGAYDRAILDELAGRAYDPPGTQRSVHPSVKQAADAHDRWSALELEIGRGRPNEHSVKGYENLKAYSGYYQQKWSGARMARLIASGTRRDAIRDSLAEAYVSMHGVTLKDARVWSDAVLRRALASDRGTDTNLIGILQQDGRGFLEQMLRDHGHTDEAINKLMDRLTGAVEKRGQAGQTKGRMDIDPRFTSSRGLRIMDLMETDIGRMVSRRSRGTAGAAALARKGIRSKTDRTAIIDAIKHEQQARGQSQSTGSAVTDLIDKDSHLDDAYLNDLFSYFDAGPIAGGVSPVYSRMKKLTNLALLNQLGLTQMAEVGVQISSVGWDVWKSHAGEAFNAALKKQDSELVHELKHLHILVPEEKLFRDDFAIETDRVGGIQSEFWSAADNILNVGQRIQGYASGFYAVRNIQQRIAVTSGADKVMRGIRDGDWNVARFADMGIDARSAAKIKSYVDSGTVEFKDGMLHKLNLKDWDAEDAENFTLSLNRHVNQVVQKAMAGESSVLFHKDGVASLFFHLKSFPILAMQKQFHRNARLADTEALYGFLGGLVTAGVAYSVKQAINGRTDNLTPEKVAKGAFGMSNMAGWIPMWTDPLASMLGMDSLKFNTYSQGIDSNVFVTPAVLPTINRIANIPGAVLSGLTGSMTNSDVRALQATPIIGNAFGMTYMFNAMKEDNRKNARKEAKVKPRSNRKSETKEQPKEPEFDPVKAALEAAS